MERELKALEVAALLTTACETQGLEWVAHEVGEPVNRILSMISGKTDFNRAVLRFLGVKKVYGFIKYGEVRRIKYNGQ